MANSVHPNLPRQATSFVGRERQVEEVRTRLQNPDCRLLTLTGPGGIGKTRLAIAIAQIWELPIVYTPLQAVASVDLVPSAIADASGSTLAGNEPLPVQLVNRLRDARMLLVLDNFEHLLDGTDLLLDIMHEAPEVQLLVTSREALNLREEWLYTVPGLDFPPADAQGNPSQSDVASYGAVRLFVERAQQVRQSFRLSDGAAPVAAICRAVDGMPLAIELAASWLSVLDRAAIAERLASSLDLLTTQLRNVPERHRSIRAVFDGSWRMLSESERSVFANLSVFRGGCKFEAAEVVAGANIAVLSSLLSKSLLHREDGGRYHVHDLLRKYATEKLAESPDDEAEIQRAHGEYYLNLLAAYKASSSSVGRAYAFVADEQNMRTAWRWAVDHHAYGLLQAAANAMMILYQLTSRYLEGGELFLDTMKRLQSGSMTAERAAVLTEIATHYGWLCLRLGRLDDAEEALTPACDLYDKFEVPGRAIGRQPFVVSMHVALARGDYVQASEFGERIRAIADETGEPKYDFNLYFPQANAALARGEYSRSKHIAGEGLSKSSSIDRFRDTAYFHSILGQVARIEGDLDTATEHFETAYRIYERLNEPGGMAENSAHLAAVAAARENSLEARRLYARSYATYEEIGDRGGIARTQLGLGVVDSQAGELAAARSHYRQALAVAADAQLAPTILHIAAAVGHLLVCEDAMHSLGLRTLCYAYAHPACDAETRARVVGHLLDSGLTPGTESCTDCDEFDDLDALVAALQVELAAPVQPASSIPPLAEPLTDREQQVLRLLAEGRTNPEIAEALVVTVGTVKSHNSHLYGKLGVGNRTEAATRARELGLLV